ncbi:cell cycle checkpoint protein RAD17 isoform X2 [Impatiens glandulifera]|uniref:cell cycle checkpoint protein RAD17 isoform X2 n=1 Tax=Impatiens glandulifera TaxID=253017 RepID=UPI001FB16348|nr:cell cycle checkpoint protein RAD17 isoform X2 [Impatiens glandulifera]
MGKRNTVVLLSSDEEEEKYYTVGSKSGSVHATVPRLNTRRRAKKTRISDSSPVCSSAGFNEIKLLCQDFDEGFRESTEYCRSFKKNLWVEKYKPCSLDELAVHKKKVDEVKTWFSERLRNQQGETSHNVLIITGAAGVGKSATVHVVASHLGATLCEWNAPTPTNWQEYVHTSSSGVCYTSKLEEFETFVEKIRKYGVISTSHSTSGEARSSTILVIDDLPMTNGRSAYARLLRCLHLLVQFARTPTIILITEYDKSDSSDNNRQNMDELQLSLQNAGACKVAFNPITVNSIKKTLNKICKEEHRLLSAEQIDFLAKSSGGDIRNAVTSLQYFCLKPRAGIAKTFPDKGSNANNSLEEGFVVPLGKDETLFLFHALGKFLHNKRETGAVACMESNAFRVKDKLARLPLKMDAPETILCQAHGQARPVADFLHENVLDFLGEEAIDDAWVISSYLSDADILVAQNGGGMLTRQNYKIENIVESAAASVAVRGVLFGNSHPLSSRWHAIRRPKSWQVDQSCSRNKLEIASQRHHMAYNGWRSCNMSVLATEWRPALKWLQSRDSNASYIESDTSEDEKPNNSSRLKENSSSSEDEIEDW